MVILLAGVVNRSRVAARLRRDCNRAPIRVILLEEGDDIVDFLVGFEARKYRPDLYLRRLDVIPERRLVPQDAAVLVGDRIAIALERSRRPAEKAVQFQPG